VDQGRGWYACTMDLTKYIIPKKSKIKSERALILSEVLEELKAGGVSYSPAFIGFKVAHVKTPDLRDFHQQCLRYKKEKGQPYGKCFFGALRVKK